MTPARRGTLIALAVGIAAIAVASWAIPSFGGRVFVSVVAHVEPTSAGATSARSVVLPDGSVSPSTQLRIRVAVTNRYPLPVVLGFRGSAIRATLAARDRPGEAPLWRGSTDDPSLESGDDSPDAGTDRVVVLQPGTTLLPAAAAELILDASRSDIPAGIYAVRVSAFGLDTAPALVSIVDAGG